jgi:hypothetical protein
VARECTENVRVTGIPKEVVRIAASIVLGVFSATINVFGDFTGSRGRKGKVVQNAETSNRMHTLKSWNAGIFPYTEGQVHIRSSWR